MDLANLWLPLIGGGVLTAVAISAWFADHKLVAIWFGFGAGVCLLLLCALQIQDNVNQSGREIVSPGMSADQRPWIEIVNVVVGPLEFDEQGGRLGVAAEIKNVGNTPAVNITLNTAVYLIGKDHLAPTEDQKRLCEEIKTRPSWVGEILFKDRTTTLRNSVPIPKADIERFGLITPGTDKQFISPAIIGCVDYMFTVGADHHQTGFIYILSDGGPAIGAELTVPGGGSAPIPQNPGAGRVIYPGDGNISIGRLYLSKWIAGGFFAD